ncbi:MAG: DUF3540 domain-containing protein [Desulfovibrio sp.]|nr:DUF3540 domain-containing protein [Desulfovibrio sp.]
MLDRATNDMLQPSLASGRVQQADRGACLVAGPFGLVRAQRAAGCLLEPQAGDTVALFFAERGAWILSVLSRTADEGALALPAKTAIRAREIRIGAESGLEIQAPCVRLEGGLLVQAFESVRTFASKIFEKASLRFGLFGKSAEHVSGLKETKASRMRVSLDENLRVRSGSADVKARESMRIDGGHINIG